MVTRCGQSINIISSAVKRGQFPYRSLRNGKETEFEKDSEMPRLTTNLSASQKRILSSRFYSVVTQNSCRYLRSSQTAGQVVNDELEGTG